MKKNKILFSLIILLLFISNMPLTAQEQDLVSANSFFDKVSDFYAEIKDYVATVRFTKGEEVQAGVLFYSSPHLLKIEFSTPYEQILLVDGERLSIYLPQYSTILEQKFSSSDMVIAPGKGLGLLKNNYIISYAQAEPVPLEEGSSEIVTKLNLYPFSGATEGFKLLIISVSSNLIIRRIEGITIKNEQVVFDFIGVTINPGIPWSIYTLDPPSMTNVYPDFLRVPEK